MITGLTLAVDGSTYAGSAAIFDGGDIVASRELDDSPVPGRGGRPENFLPMVAGCFADAGVKALDLERVVCGAGPGSFTSLRVAASIAKGIAVGAGCPLYAVSSLVLVVAGSAPGRYLATLPAMRGELFSALLEVGSEGSVSEIAPPTIIAGTAAAGVATSAHALVSDVQPHAKRVQAVLQQVLSGGACDIDTWEPTYGRLAEAQVRWEAQHGRPLSEAR